jgi:hypothetical protein
MVTPPMVQIDPITSPALQAVTTDRRFGAGRLSVILAGRLG